MQFIKKTLENLENFISKDKSLAKFKPLVSAFDEFFFGTDKQTAVPHIVDHIDLKRFMSFVIIGLLPATIASIYFWGLKVIAIILVSYIFGGIVEVVFAVIRKKEIHEGFLVTGLIFPLILPPTVPLWIAAVGVMFGVLFGKEVFGGTGRNIFNPALVGRIFLSVAFPKIMAAEWKEPVVNGLRGFLSYSNVDTISSATPLTLFKNTQDITPYLNLLFGQASGCIGETFRIGIILGGLFLIFTKIIDWRLPLSYLITTAVFSFITHQNYPQFAPPLFQILSGGLVLGAFFMLTDPVTSPFTKQGRWIAGIIAGILTVLIRAISGYVEGVMFSILLVNMVTPLIDTIVLNIRYRKKVNLA